MARLPTLASSQSVSFRHGTNVEFNTPGFTGLPSIAGNALNETLPVEGYNLQRVNTNKSRDFSNPMYDAVQTGSTSRSPNPNINGSGK